MTDSLSDIAAKSKSAVWQEKSLFACIVFIHHVLNLFTENLLKNGQREEVEIRGCTIEAVEVCMQIVLTVKVLVATIGALGHF